MTKSLKRKEHSNKDFKFMDQCYQKLNKYFPYNSYTDKRYDHLVLMQDLVKAFPPFEITGGAETKKLIGMGLFVVITLVYKVKVITRLKEKR